MNFYDRPLGGISPTPYTRPPYPRPIRGICLHHTATQFDPVPRSAGSWHWLVAADGSLIRDVAEEDIAHHAGATDRWRPGWVTMSPVGVSDVNWCSIGVELTYAPQDGQVPSDAQHAALNMLLLHLYGRYGPLPIVGHGEIDRSKWPTEPHALNWTAAGIGPPDNAGRWLLPQRMEDLDVSILQDEEIDRIIGVVWGRTPYNPALAIDRAVREELKSGRWRGKPLTMERPIPHRADGDDAAYRVFAHGLCVYRAGQTSWEG